MAREITYETIHEALIAAVKDRGADWKYPDPPEPETDELGYDVYPDDKWHDEEGSCVFVLNDGSGPACIVGYALDYLGYPIREMPNGSADDALDWLTDYAQTPKFRRGGEQYGVANALLKAQTAQDNHRPWGEALDKFEQEYAVLTGGK